MLKKGLSRKRIAIIGHQTLTAKIILKKLIAAGCRSIVILQSNRNPEKNQKYASDSYFSEPEQREIQSNVLFLALEEAAEMIKDSIDLLFCAFSFVDFSSPDKIVNNHTLATSKIAAALGKINIEKCVLLSSVYVRGPGYVPEEEELEEAAIPARFSSKTEALSYLKDNFQNPIEAWRWSMNYVEHSYFGLAKQNTVLRVPSLGPTVANYEGRLCQPSPFAYLLCQAGLGLIRSLEGVGSTKVDVVPTDYASHLMLVLAVR